MCGIGVRLAAVTSSGPNRDNTAWRDVLENIKRRGPDCFDSLRGRAARPPATPSSNVEWEWELASSVLALRGDGVTQQPLCSADGRFLFAWNGQLFAIESEGSETSTSSWRLQDGLNDTRWIFDQILARIPGDEPLQAVVAALAQLEGPYAFAFFDRQTSKLIFGRDPLGRRSLLLHSSNDGKEAILSSVSCDKLASGSDWTVEEVDCSTLWTLDMATGPSSMQAIPRQSRLSDPLLLCELRSSSSPGSTAQNTSWSTQERQAYQTRFGKALEQSVKERVTTVQTDQDGVEARIAVLFSGGLDCTTLALLADRYVPEGQPIDLLNVAFENVRAIEAAKRHKLQQRQAAARPKPGKKSRKISTVERADSLASEVEKVALEDKAPDVQAAGEEDEAISIYEVPDRVTGRSSLLELQKLAPKRRWNFVEIDVAYSEYCQHRGKVEELMYPSTSVMDLSIASALYFASRGVGVIRSQRRDRELSPDAPDDPTHTYAYTSPAKVLISGLGADELLGGYSRHRAAYREKGLAGLVHELQMDLDRLPTRNLGRDDRILSTWGREARYPYLSHAVRQVLTDIPVSVKMSVPDIQTEGAGGDKSLLRSLAYDLGLVQASHLKKRAMQFGTRSAKIDDDSRHAKGHHSLAPNSEPKT
ncbi:hypothetical protein BCV70DRAFT_202039 [Testicularia cyperi]|uniref:Glutamine amidotransferase type-2 domain-containing protein n=1 Tax=Testicularia cyperi TaxID=1882483 RepID=A0A317XKB6_9BASI|nr:hypothetical protein BCV70DRAFT_202039 [Testicularia cyperi]